MKSKWLGFLLVGFAALLSAQDYTLTPISDMAIAVGINSSGQVAGTVFTTHNQAFIWTKAGGIQYLGDLGGGNSQARAINEGGDVVGFSSLPGGVTHAFLWTHSGGMKDLGSPLGGVSDALHINDTKQVAMISATPDETIAHTFFWSQGTGAVDVGTLGGSPNVAPGGINNSGAIFGTANIGGLFRWTLATGIQALVPDGVARAINDSGVITGNIKDPLSGRQHAALWAPDGSFQDLGVLPGYIASQAYYINAAGHITGVLTPSAGSPHTFFWTSSGGMIDIGTPSNKPKVPVRPAALNDNDQVVGKAGQAFFWSPSIPTRTVSKAIPNAGAFNNTGQFAGSLIKVGAVLATPLMHVSLISSQNPSQIGHNVTFTANVNSITGLPPNGEQVTFTDGSTVLGIGTLSNGVATLMTTFGKVGTHYIRATYVGDTIYDPNKSLAIQQVVTQ